MNRIFRIMAVILAVIFICTNAVATIAAPCNEYAKDDYRDKIIKNSDGEEVAKPFAQFMAIRKGINDLLETTKSYSGMDINLEFPVLECYVGDTLSFKDLSNDSINGGLISVWDWQYYGQLGDFIKEANYNIVNQTSFNLTTPGETTFFLCVKSNVKPKYGTCDPWSDNGNHQTIGKNKWFPAGMYWYFNAIRVIVHPYIQAKVNMRYWDVPNNKIFYEEVVYPGELQDDSTTIETSVHITDWEGYKFLGWNVVLPDGTVQYSGIERNVGITLASWLPEKYLNVEFEPIANTSEPPPIDPTPTPIPQEIPVETGDCNGEIAWTENDSHEVLTGYNKQGKPIYKTCYHTFKYKAVLTATATTTPNKLKSGYGFETKVNCDVSVSLISNTGRCSSWGNTRVSKFKVSPPTTANVKLSYTVKNTLGTQAKTVAMERCELGTTTSSFQTAQNPISVKNSRTIYTDVLLAGTTDNPVTHYYDVYINGGGVNGVEFCKKITECFISSGSMYDDDGTSS